jgi:DNA polymerase-3 subunit delta
MPLFSPLQLYKLVDLASKNRIAPLYLFIGPHEISQEKAKEIYRVILEKGAGLEIYDLRDPEQKREFLNARGYQEGLFGLRTIYLVSPGEEIPLSKAEEILNNLQKANQLFTWFIFFNEIEEAHPFYQFAMEKGALIPLHTKKRSEFLESEILPILKQYGLSMDKKAQNLFLTLIGEDYQHFRKELEKLVLYCLDEKVITEERVLEVVTASEEQALYLLGDSLFEAGPERTYRKVQQFLDIKKEPTEILNYLYKYFKKLRILKDLLENNPELEKAETYTHFLKAWQSLTKDPLKEIPRILTEAHPYVVFKMRNYLKRLKDLDVVFKDLFEAEWKLKREFRPPAKVFQEFLFNFWQRLSSSER